MQFRQWYESVYRIDNDRIDDFQKNLKSYHHTPDWKHSGTFSQESDVPAGWNKSKGLFAGELKDVIPYATPRDVKWVKTFENPKRPTVTFDQRDRARIIAYRPYLSQLPSAEFSQKPSGEFFSTNPPSASKQEPIRNPINFMKQWYNVNFVPDIEAFANQLKSQNIQFDAEGLM